MTVEMINRPGGGTGKPLPIDDHVLITPQDARTETLRRLVGYCRFMSMHVYESKIIHVDDAPIMSAAYLEAAEEIETGNLI